MGSGAQNNQPGLLEVIACTVEDAVSAELGGADRLEIISQFNVGGLTPPLDLVREIKAKISVPLRVMLRESEGYGTSGEEEVEKLCEAARQLNQIQVDGIVLGFLKSGEIDSGLMQRILSCAPDMRATFHHAFEDSTDKLFAIEKLKRLRQVDRILAHGGHGSWEEKAFRLETYAGRAQPEIKILAGGGVDAEVIKLLKATSSVEEFHVGSAARENVKVQTERVATLAHAVKSESGRK